jgi:hypothetical protein
MDMATIQKLMPSRSRISVFRDLKNIDYISSYNKAGSFYTLKGIPRFDELGIWKHSDIYFSSHGSLKNTVKHLVCSSKSGHTHYELQNILGVRVHNTLLDLAANGVITRETYPNYYVYTSITPDIRSQQLDERRKSSCLNHSKQLLDPYITIEVLRAVITHPEHSVEDIKHCLSKEGIRLKLEQVNEIFELYDIGKKNYQ